MGGVRIKIALLDLLFVCIYEFENLCTDLEFLYWRIFNKTFLATLISTLTL